MNIQILAFGCCLCVNMYYSHGMESKINLFRLSGSGFESILYPLSTKGEQP